MNESKTLRTEKLEEEILLGLKAIIDRKGSLSEMICFSLDKHYKFAVTIETELQQAQEELKVVKEQSVNRRENWENFEHVYTTLLNALPNFSESNDLNAIEEMGCMVNCIIRERNLLQSRLATLERVVEIFKDEHSMWMDGGCSERMRLALLSVTITNPTQKGDERV